jgi:hypothetical protein
MRADSAVLGDLADGLLFEETQVQEFLVGRIIQLTQHLLDPGLILLPA